MNEALRRIPSLNDLVRQDQSGMQGGDYDMLKAIRAKRNARAAELGIDLNQPPAEPTDPMQKIVHAIIRSLRGERAA